MSAQSYRNLKQQVVELVAVNEALGRKLGEVCGDFDRQICAMEKGLEINRAETARANEERDEQVRLKQFHRRRYDEASKLYSEEVARAKRYEEERDKAQQDLQVARWTLVGVERERDAARAVADTMRHQAYPPGPLLPWETTSEHGR